MNFQEINDYFGSSGFSNIAEHSGYIFIIVSILIILSVMIEIKDIRQKQVKYYPHGTVTDTKLIASIMRTALDQRRTFDAHLHVNDDKHHPYLRCTLLNINKTTLLFELNGIKQLSDIWKDRRFNIFFRITQFNSFIYYTFSSNIISIKHPYKDICHVEFSMPTVLENRQKRSCLRMPPPSDLILGSAIWYGNHMPNPQDMLDISLWREPSFFLIIGKIEHYGLLDLSASGVRIFFSHQMMSGIKTVFQVNNNMILMLDLLDPDTGKRLRCWINCRIQNIWKENKSKAVSLGLKFMSWARPKENLSPEESDSSIEWLKLSRNNELEHIGNWIMRRHLEMYREGNNQLD